MTFRTMSLLIVSLSVGVGCGGKRDNTSTTPGGTAPVQSAWTTYYTANPATQNDAVKTILPITSGTQTGVLVGHTTGPINFIDANGVATLEGSFGNVSKLIQTNDGRIFAYAIASRVKSWNEKVGPAVSSLGVSRGNLIAVRSDIEANRAELLCIRPKLWTRAWPTGIIEGPVSAPVVCTDEAIYVACEDRSLYCFDAQNGWPIGRLRTPGILRDPPVVLAECRQKAAKRLPKSLWQSLLAATIDCQQIYLAAADGTGFSRSGPSQYYLKRIDRKNVSKRSIQTVAMIDVEKRKFFN